MEENNIVNSYFEWLVDLVCGERFAKDISYNKLLTALHNIEFKYIIPNDMNRAEDGIDLRYRFAIKHYSRYVDEVDDIVNALFGPCSVLEMLIALSIRCEENIMDDPAYGDRTRQWFWGMVRNLGIGAMMDERFDHDRVIEAVDKLINRTYEPNGKGGLFTIKNCECDLRYVEIWRQLCWYLDTFV